MTRPYVIVHTHTSIDGNIDVMDLPEFVAGSQRYQDIALTPDRQVPNINAYLNGKTSTQDNIAHYKVPELDERASGVPDGDFLAEPGADMYYISIDPRGELAWQDNRYGYGGVQAHFIEVLTDQASNAHKDYLRRKHISYIIAGKSQIGHEVMLAKLYELGINRLMVGGGGTINWSLLQAGLIDEASPGSPMATRTLHGSLPLVSPIAPLPPSRFGSPV